MQNLLIDPRDGEAYRMSPEYLETVHEEQGKASAQIDLFTGRSPELIPSLPIVESIDIEFKDPSFAEATKATTTLYQDP